MTTELKPLGNSCNLECTYCYEFPLRAAGNEKQAVRYDLDLMLEIGIKQGQPLSVFGGEGLLLPIKDLKRIFEESHKHFGMAYIQTNATLINDEHINLFKEYNVKVGVSIDGPNDLNDLRVSKQKNKTTQELTQTTIENIRRLREHDITVGMIITVHKMNGTKDKLPRLLQFLKWLKTIGVKDGHIHMMEVDDEKAKEFALTEEENTWAFLELAKFLAQEENQDLFYTPFCEIKRMLRGEDARACIFNSCDALNTQSVFGIEGNGAISNCGMVNKEGIEWFKASDQAYMRDVLLYQTDQELGGCKGCRFFLMCNGYCTGSAWHGDWRNRSVFCETLKALFEFYEHKMEEKGQLPLSKSPNLKRMEADSITSMLHEGKRILLSELAQRKYSVVVPIGKGEESQS